jgi:sulfoxide reductase heme-binding subunit YedZ
LLALVFLSVHVCTTILDGYVTISWWSVVVPGASNYRTLWVALGTIALDLIVLVTATSLLRLRMSHATWQRIHVSSYALWPLVWLHYLKTGTDAGGVGLLLGIGCAGVIGVAAGFRVLTDNTPTPVASVR